MATLKYPQLRNLDFGRLSASEEARVSPDLLLSGYHDFQQAAYRIARGTAWVVVGPKGAGKTASIEHLDLMWRTDEMKFLEKWDLASFPVADVTGLQIGTQPGPSSTRAAWEFLILLRIFESLVGDMGITFQGNVVQLTKDLAAAGLIQGPDLRTKFFDWSQTTVKFNVGFVGVDSGKDSGATAIQIVEILRVAISSMATDSRHVLAIDGLDGFFAQSNQQLDALAALVEAAAGVNAFLEGTKTRSSVLLAIRSDMFSQLPSTDSAKLGDHMVELDWSRGGTGHGNELWSLVNAKAQASVHPSFEGRPLKDVRTAYFESPIGIGPHSSIPAYFLSHTRLLPRDLVALMTEVKGVHGGSSQLTEANARESVRRYSETYFIREVGNGLARVLPGASATKVAAFIESLTTLQSRYFQATDLNEELAGMLDQTELRALLKQLYTIGALGVNTTVNGTRHVNFIYRRTAGGGFSFLREYTLHNSLVVAWNLHW
ncbi:hypothetical protein E3O44_06030 [Cryobacterium algoricola]|uniref:ATP-binding protein n=1 Tax=Cryobacterium algoricola TaxID=1259183 RepID=A0ABY2IH65_9MICO|nr:hypothetical protein [Cryobacterium algoricola]TFB88230.1 hypothetical protein E3O44_06030 [Cryobacterium algoricola]